MFPLKKDSYSGQYYTLFGKLPQTLGYYKN